MVGSAMGEGRRYDRRYALPILMGIALAVMVTLAVMVLRGAALMIQVR